MGGGAETPNVQRYSISRLSQKQGFFLIFFYDIPYFILRFSVFHAETLIFKPSYVAHPMSRLIPNGRSRNSTTVTDGWRWTGGRATDISLCKRKNRAVQRYAMGRGAEIPNGQRYIFWTVPTGTCFFFCFFFSPTFRTFHRAPACFRRNMDSRTLLDRPAHATADPKGIVQKFHNGNSWMERAAIWRYATHSSLCKRKNRAAQRYAMSAGARNPKRSAFQNFWTVPKATFSSDVRTFY